MKKINAFYCIKTPSDWKESVLMYDKPTEKNKTKLTGFQLAGAVLASGGGRCADPLSQR